MWLNSLNNYEKNNSKNNKNIKEIQKWEIEFNSWFKTWKYNWEYYIDDNWEKIEHWTWTLNLDGFKWKEIYEGKFEEWYIIEWTIKKIDNDWKFLTKKWKFKSWELVEWSIEENNFIWEWKFEKWKLLEWYYISLKTWKKFIVKNWIKRESDETEIKKDVNNSVIINEEIKNKISETIISLENVKTKIFEKLLEIFYSASEWEITEKVKMISYWIEIIWKIKNYLLSIENYKDKNFEILELTVKIKNNSEELNNIFYKYWFNEYKNLFNHFIDKETDLLSSISNNISNSFK